MSASNTNAIEDLKDFLAHNIARVLRNWKDKQKNNEKK